jgi:transcriptional regulator with XRE-family HTH domain
VTRSGAGTLIRDGRLRARRSQLDLALDVGVSPRHLSFVELGKAKPSPELILVLAERLDVPLRERNDWLLAAGYAPRFPETPLDGPAMEHVRATLQGLLDAHEPYPAVVIDRRWTVQLTNAAAIRLAEGIAPEARGVPSNIFRISLHADGFARRTRNLAEWSGYLLRQLDRAIVRTGDPELVALGEEIAGWPHVPPRPSWREPPPGGRPELVVPWQLAHRGEELSLFTTMSTFGTAVDITLAELSIELFLPADPPTAKALRRWAAEPSAPAGGR